MTRLRVGTRGSDLALWQTRWFCNRLRAAHPGVEIEEIVIKTHGDTATEQLFDADWPVGGFVGAIEQSLAGARIDFAVHSFKDLQTQATAGLIIAAVPGREVVHDTLVTREPFDLEHVSSGFKLGTSSPRRAAQFRRVCADAKIVPIRGNVPTRIAKIERENLDGVILAGAGMKRLGLTPPHATPLPIDRFVPAPAQGALAIQTRDNDEASKLISALDDPAARREVETERAFLRAINAGCHTPVGALSTNTEEGLRLRGQLFDDDGSRMVEDVETGTNPTAIGEALAERLLTALGQP